MARSDDQITRLKDRIASYFIKAGGVFVLSAMMGIFFFLIWVTYPLFQKVRVENGLTLSKVLVQNFIPDTTGLAAIATDAKHGVFLINLRQGSIISRSTKAPKLPWISVTPTNATGQILVVDSNRTIHIGTLKILKPRADMDPAKWIIEDQWIQGPRLPQEIQQVFDFSTSISYGLIESLNYTIATRSNRGVRFITFSVPADSMMGEQSTAQDILLPLDAMVRHGLFSDDGSRFFIVTQDGRLQVYSLSEGTRLLSEKKFDEPVQTISFLLGDRTLLVGGQRGSVSAVQWVRVKSPTGKEEYILDEYHQYPSLGRPILGFASSPKDKRFLVWTENDSYLAHATSEKVLWLKAKIESGYFLPNGKGLWIQSGSDLKELTIDDKHPDITVGTLTKPIQYEGYTAKEYVWQSSSATDDSEPKYSLIPLIFGTLKGTLYALIFAIPIAVLGAIYTSQFASLRWRNIIKPSIEMMAALPSVVLGFIGGLVIAPYFQKMSVSVFILLPVFLVVFLALIPLWLVVPATRRRRLSSGAEFLWCIPVLITAYFVSIELTPLIETRYFSGNFVQHLLTNYDLKFDQRNSLVLGFVLGFAVIPLIYTISEDALSSVPKSLTSASLACGASQWQTAWRVVLPTASPGIFSGIMIGVGRAVGETMIVLMATGNTPIMDWSGFNGLRSLAANIAVEMPEAPLLGTHYRVLFLSALLLFIFTFILNTLAEVVSSNLRRKYESL
jgi:phosphate transport system permease protein